MIETLYGDANAWRLYFLSSARMICYVVKSQIYFQAIWSLIVPKYLYRFHSEAKTELFSLLESISNGKIWRDVFCFTFSHQITSTVTFIQQPFHQGYGYKCISLFFITVSKRLYLLSPRLSRLLPFYFQIIEKAYKYSLRSLAGLHRSSPDTPPYPSLRPFRGNVGHETKLGFTVPLSLTTELLKKRFLSRRNEHPLKSSFQRQER